MSNPIYGGITNTPVPLVNVDQIFDPKSANPQSGLALADALFIKPTLSGNIITANDVSPIEHELKVRIKNYFVLKNVNKGDNGVTVNDDNTLTVVPTNSTRIILGKLTDICPELKGGEGIVLSYSDINKYNAMGLIKYKDNTATGASEDIMYTTPKGDTNNMITSGMLPEDLSNVYIYYSYDNTTHTVSNIVVRTGNPVDLADLTFSRYGKNLFAQNKEDMEHAVKYNTSGLATGIVKSRNGLDLSYENDTLYFTPDSSATVASRLQFLLPLENFIFGETYTFTIVAEILPTLVYVGTANSHNDTSTIDIFNDKMFVNGSVFTIKTESEKPYLILAAYFGNVEIGKKYAIKGLQIEVGSTSTQYEPYIKPQIATINADGTVNGLMSISPNMTIVPNHYGIDFECEYIADTKMYIDNKFNELSKALLNV